MNKFLAYFIFFGLISTMASCTGDDIVQNVSQLPNEATMNAIGGILYSESTLSREIPIGLYEGDTKAIERISYVLTSSAKKTFTIKAVHAPDLVEAYNLANNTEFKKIPAANISIEDDGELTISKGKKNSEVISMTISTEGLDFDEFYLLPLTLTQYPENIETISANQVLYYQLRIQKKLTQLESNFNYFENIPDLLPDVNMVFYINTETYKPSVVSAWGINKSFRFKYSLGNIVNLKKAEIDYDDISNRCKLKLGVDLSYILENQNKYVRILQDYGRKICLCIENGGRGVGFCNMDDKQIADFVSQVKLAINRYHLDGVNLWDEDSKYVGAEINKTSYPKLIKALREAMPDKLLTLVDKGNATEYFYDKALCGGIEVGRYIDYAWHGYFSDKEEVQIINPSTKDAQEYSQYVRKPIAGLNESCYGCVNIARYSSHDFTHRNVMSLKIAKWKTLGNKTSNILVYGSDLIGNEYAEKENAMSAVFSSSITYFMDDGALWKQDPNTGKEGTTIVNMYGTTPLDYKINDPNLNNYKKDW